MFHADGRTDGHTYMTKVTVAFRNLRRRLTTNWKAVAQAAVSRRLLRSATKPLRMASVGTNSTTRLRRAGLSATSTNRLWYSRLVHATWCTHAHSQWSPHYVHSYVNTAWKKYSQAEESQWLSQWVRPNCSSLFYFKGHSGGAALKIIVSGLCRSRPDDGPSKESHRRPKTLSSGTGLRV
jgi:hypothetical protein